jgi:hypothetical protein
MLFGLRVLYVFFVSELVFRREIPVLLPEEPVLSDRLLTTCRLKVLSPGSGELFLLFDDVILRL